MTFLLFNTVKTNKKTKTNHPFLINQMHYITYSIVLKLEKKVFNDIQYGQETWL